MFRSPLKEDSEPALRMLRESLHQLVMITGEWVGRVGGWVGGWLGGWISWPELDRGGVRQALVVHCVAGVGRPLKLCSVLDCPLTRSLHCQVWPR